MKASELIQTLWPRTQWPCPVCSKRSLCRCPIADDTDLEQVLMDVAVAKWNERLAPPLIIEAVKLAATALDDGEGAWSRSDLGHLLNDALAECRRIMMKRAAEQFAGHQGAGELVFVRPRFLPPCRRCSQTSLCGCRVDNSVLELVDVLFTRYSHVPEGDLVQPLSVLQEAVKAQPKRKWTREELGQVCDEVVHEALPDAQPYQTVYMPAIKREDGSLECVPITEELRRQVDSQDSSPRNPGVGRAVGGKDSAALRRRARIAALGEDDEGAK